MKRYGKTKTLSTVVHYTGPVTVRRKRPRKGQRLTPTLGTYGTARWRDGEMRPPRRRRS